MSKIKDDIFSYQDFINIIIDNSIYTKIEIGEPKQELIAWINTEEYSYYIYKDMCILNSFYDENKSSTYNPNNEYHFFYNGYGKTIYINESISFQNKKIKNFPIMFMKDPKNDEFFNQRFSIKDITGKTCATIGLRFIKNYNDKISKNFISILNDLDIIDDYIIFFEYDEFGNEKFLLLGEYPEMIFKNKYIFKETCSTNINIYNRFKPQWGFKCDKILSGNINIEQNNIALHHNLGVIYAPAEYKDIIEKKFFFYYINKNICKKKNNGEYIFFYCNNKIIEDEKFNFPELKFIKNEFEKEFILTFDDLFFTKGNNSYFLVVFHRLYDEIWELGKPFLKKYLFAYNFDSKKIIHYNRTKNIIIKEEKEKEYNNKKNFFEYIIFIILFSIFIGIFCFLLGKRIYNRNKNKIKAKELENNFSYTYNYKINKLIDE